jgi:hypothetical protein
LFVAGLWQAAPSFLEPKPLLTSQLPQAGFALSIAGSGKRACNSQSTSMIKIKVESGRMTAGSKLARNHQDCMIANARFARLSSYPLITCNTAWTTPAFVDRSLG